MGQLRRADVLRGARDLLDDEGLDAFTMRRLGSRLDVRAGALYWHFPNKQALLEAVADDLMTGVGDDLPDAPWPEQVTALAVALRRALLSVRDGARLIGETFVTDTNHVFLGETAVRILTQAGLPPDRAAWTLFVLAHYILGNTIEEQTRRQTPPGELTAKLATGGPLAALADADPDERFLYGVHLIIDGIRHQLSHPS
ncbi:TetR/AcrR family transcriptional regulator C-terminal domain-containing protein [Actinoplanes sp. NPDC000266]